VAKPSGADRPVMKFAVVSIPVVASYNLTLFPIMFARQKSVAVH